MTNLIDFVCATSPRLRDAWDHLAQRPRDADAQLQFARELQRHPEALTAWRRYHEERPSRGRCFLVAQLNKIAGGKRLRGGCDAG